MSKMTGKITPSVINHILYWARLVCNNPNIRWTKRDAEIFYILEQEKKHILHENYVQTKEAKYAEKVEAHSSLYLLDLRK